MQFHASRIHVAFFNFEIIIFSSNHDRVRPAEKMHRLFRFFAKNEKLSFKATVAVGT